MQSKHLLRKSIRCQRRHLSAQEQRNAQQGLVQSARQCQPLWQSNRVLSYVPFEGEASPEALVQKLKPSQLFLPKITNYRQREMRVYAAEACKTLNRFGIAEPKATHSPVAVNKLDLILMPLVAFDRSGNRLGMGAGYYDRALQACQHQTSTRPLLIGVAHGFQEVNRIHPEPWDISLDAILTENEYIPIASKLIRGHHQQSHNSETAFRS